MIKPIETQYKGYRFRSRLEARWAVFFDALEIRWEYEPEGFDLGKAGWYLPDFWLPDYDCWFEIKRGEDAVSEVAILRVKTLCDGMKTSGAIVCGLPTPDIGPVRWAECLRCRHLFPVGVTTWVCPVPKCTSKHETFHPLQYCGCTIIDKTNGITLLTCESKRLVYAYEAARAARFEHGETPRL